MRDNLISIVTLVLAIGLTTGAAWSDENAAQALQAETIGFDALAHGMFGGLTAAPDACPDQQLASAK